MTWNRFQLINLGQYVWSVLEERAISPDQHYRVETAQLRQVLDVNLKSKARECAY